MQKDNLKYILSLNRPATIQVENLKLSKSITNKSDGEWTVTTELFTITYGIGPTFFFEDVNEAIDKFLSLLQ
jgi:hypothetical protein